MKWRQVLEQTEKQEAEREAIEAKTEEHLKVLQDKNILKCVLLRDHWVLYRIRIYSNMYCCMISGYFTLNKKVPELLCCANSF
jgi:hypothetical protein